MSDGLSEAFKGSYFMNKEEFIKMMDRDKLLKEIGERCRDKEFIGNRNTIKESYSPFYISPSSNEERKIIIDVIASMVSDILDADEERGRRS